MSWLNVIRKDMLVTIKVGYSLTLLAPIFCKTTFLTN